MLFGLVMSVILVAAGLSLFLTGIGRLIPAGVRLVPFLELALLWLHLLVFRGKVRWLDTVFLVQYWVVFILIVLPAGLGLWAIEAMDRERALDPVVLGNAAAESEIAVIYHPGGSDFTLGVLKGLGEKLGEAGHKIVLYTAHRGLHLNLEGTAAVGLASPIYGGSIRPPLQRFIRSADLGGRRCFAVVTGGPGPAEGEWAQKDLQSVSPIEERGGQVVAARKIPQNKKPGAVDEKIDAFAGELLAALR